MTARSVNRGLRAAARAALFSLMAASVTAGLGACSSCRGMTENMVLNDPPVTVLQCAGFETPGYARMSARYQRGKSLQDFIKEVKRFPRHADIARARLDGSGGAQMTSHRSEGNSEKIEGTVTYPEGKQERFTSVLVQDAPGDYRVDALSFGGYELR